MWRKNSLNGKQGKRKKKIVEERWMKKENTKNKGNYWNRKNDK